jgi:hypothetical protein
MSLPYLHNDTYESLDDEFDSVEDNEGGQNPE